MKKAPPVQRHPAVEIANKVLWFVGVALFLYFVYPTPWVENRVAERTTRYNRVTGVEQISSPNGWVSPAKPQDAIEVLDIRYDGDKVSCKFHNRSDQLMLDVEATVSLLNTQGEVAATDYLGGPRGEEVKAGDTVLWSGFSGVTLHVSDPSSCKIRIDEVRARPYP